MKSSKIEQMKEGYDQIKIPIVLEQIVRQSIQKAKVEIEMLEYKTHNADDNIDHSNRDQVCVEEINAFHSQENTGTEEATQDSGNGEKVLIFASPKMLRFIKRFSQIATAAILFIAIMANTSSSFVRYVEEVPFIGNIANATMIRGAWGNDENADVDEEKAMAEGSGVEVALVDEENMVAGIAEDVAEEFKPEQGMEMEEQILEESLKGERMAPEQGVADSPMEADGMDDRTAVLEDGGASLEVTAGEFYNLEENGTLEGLEACTNGVMMGDIFVEGSDYRAILSEYITQEITSDSKLTETGAESTSGLAYQVTGEEYIYFNADEDLVIQIEDSIEKGMMIEIVIPREQLEPILSK